MPQTLSFKSGTTELVDVECATEEEILAFANKVRAAGGADVLEALLPSVPYMPNQCLVANALNFSCNVQSAPEYVSPLDSGVRPFAMYFPQNMEEKQIRAIGASLDLEIERNIQDRYYMILPEDICYAARAFDAGVAFHNLVHSLVNPA